MKILLTGAAGFIGHHTAIRLLERGDAVVGIDNLNDYYAVSLKQDRLTIAERHPRFRFLRLDIGTPNLFDAIGANVDDVDIIVHLAAQAGVRYSMQNPYAYVHSNVLGQVAIMELAARLPKRPTVVYASSSSVYGLGESTPFSESARADKPISVYAATKRAGEMLAHAYEELYGIRSTGLRFFTVYGRYGRPDMAPWLFTDAILKGEPISVFNNGDMLRDFTHVSDIVAGVVGATDRAADATLALEPVYNLGNNKPVKLADFIAAIESAARRKAVVEFKPKPPGDVTVTYADISLAERDLGFSPKTSIEAGMADFVEWFRSYEKGETG
ncbi:MAG: SDR family NAD(P)-dependent oxidoreductase [Rhizobiaceae bacterium]|nr:SDR family NAD(P)-dependent oxidoreductase [Rhizobiaceae bacterium]